MLGSPLSKLKKTSEAETNTLYSFTKVISFTFFLDQITYRSRDVILPHHSLQLLHSMFHNLSVEITRATWVKKKKTSNKGMHILRTAGERLKQLLYINSCWGKNKFTSAGSSLSMDANLSENSKLQLFLFFYRIFQISLVRKLPCFMRELP